MKAPNSHACKGTMSVPKCVRGINQGDIGIY